MAHRAIPLSRGGTLDLKVVGGETAPATPKENTIWIESNIALNKYGIGNKNPFIEYSNIDLLDGVATSTGYLSTSGGVTAQSSTNKEVYTTDFIQLISGKSMIARIDCDTSRSHWLAVNEYDSSGTHLSRVVVIDNQSFTSFDWYYTPSSSAVTQIKVSWRSYGDSSLKATLIAYDVETPLSDLTTGDVWIKTAEDSLAPTVANIKNKFIIYPVRAYQYDGTSWVYKPAYTYLSGDWKEWYVPVYLNGKQFITFSPPAVADIDSRIGDPWADKSLRMSSPSNTTSYFHWLTDGLDLSDCSELVFEMRAYCTAYPTYPTYAQLCLADDINSSNIRQNNNIPSSPWEIFTMTLDINAYRDAGYDDSRVYPVFKTINSTNWYRIYAMYYK